MDEILKFAEDRLDQMLADLEYLVNLDSPTSDKERVDQAMQFVIQRFTELTGGVVETIQQDNCGNQVKLHLNRGAGQLIILGHVDTVWPIGEAAARPYTRDEHKAYGPGIFDMKCGLIQGLYAMAALVQLYPDRLNKNIAFLVNTDEEMGSRTSRGWIEHESAQSDAVFVLEPALGTDGALKTERKGVGRFTADIQGVSAHSGIDHRNGISAVEEMAHQILHLQSLTDYEIGSTVNVGMASGGEGVNVVSGKAKLAFEMRVQTISEMQRLVQEAEQLKPRLSGTSISVQGGMIRPPMERQASRILFAEAQMWADRLGFPLKEAGTGGASDGNFTAALGTPTLDGMGAVGEGAHALHEYVILEHIPKRTALLAHLLLDQLN